MKQSKGVVEKRRQQLLRLLEGNHSISVEELADTLNVSPVTIRRDLLLFEEQNIIERFYGGARLRKGAVEKEVFNSKSVYTYMKKTIAKRAAGLVKDGEVVFINSGSTAFLLFHYLSQRSVTIVTNNGRAIFRKATDKATVVLSGGEIHEPKKSLVGDIAMHAFMKLTADCCFLGVGGISSNGITTYSYQEASVNKMILERTTGLKVVVTEGRKVGRDANFFMTNCEAITHLITDRSADSETVRALKERGIKVLFVS